MDGMQNAGRSAVHGWSETEPCRIAERGGGSDEEAPRNLLILSDIRFLREGLAAVLARDSAFLVVGMATDLDEAIAAAAVRPSPIILVDTTLPDGRAAVARLRQLAPSAQIVALALSETEADVIAWAEAGVCGYVPRSTPLDELAGFLGKIMRREQVCSSRVAGGLLRWIADAPRAAGAKAASDDATTLTAREDQIVRLVAAGLSNKEIARRLDIGLATVKSHVHNVLGKLGLSRRSQVAQWTRFHEPAFGGPWNAAMQPAERS
jgi:two-component system, NarL family, nitrate/nitrite response regulator NarL